jgi:hypothetical protein
MLSLLDFILTPIYLLDCNIQITIAGVIRSLTTELLILTREHMELKVKKQAAVNLSP